MELKKKVIVMKVAMLVFLMGSFSAIVEPSSNITQPVMNDNTVNATKHYMSNSLASKPCCDSCLCTRSIPPQCRCTDIGETCHSACKSCICTRLIYFFSSHLMSISRITGWSIPKYHSFNYTSMLMLLEDCCHL
ncbi:hypothetical protein Lal_00047526 [Lupinus albus]|nr:hypothetical protein Lal_00047526 [Lupinus albus]